jgi:hypothetical protein
MTTTVHTASTVTGRENMFEAITALLAGYGVTLTTEQVVSNLDGLEGLVYQAALNLHMAENAVIEAHNAVVRSMETNSRYLRGGTLDFVYRLGQGAADFDAAVAAHRATKKALDSAASIYLKLNPATPAN